MASTIRIYLERPKVFTSNDFLIIRNFGQPDIARQKKKDEAGPREKRVYETK